MTHTLHRIKKPGEIETDFVILVMPARGINNDESCREKLKRFLRIFEKNNAVNLGGIGAGHTCENSAEEVIANVYPDMPMVHGVFDCRENLINALKDIKKADMGISIIVSGLVNEVDSCVMEAGLKRHSINYSLGIWGDESKLPDEKYLKIATMCGHAMVSPNYIKDVVVSIRKGSLSIDEAAKELARPCVCGIFNPEKAKKILESIV